MIDGRNRPTGGRTGARARIGAIATVAKLAATLIAHLKSEDWARYPELLRHPEAAVAATAHRFNDEMGGLASAFAVYSNRWTTMTIQSNWTGFCSESRAIVEALSRRIECEANELYPLAERSQKAA